MLIIQHLWISSMQKVYYFPKLILFQIKQFFAIKMSLFLKVKKVKQIIIQNNLPFTLTLLPPNLSSRLTVSK